MKLEKGTFLPGQSDEKKKTDEKRYQKVKGLLRKLNISDFQYFKRCRSTL